MSYAEVRTIEELFLYFKAVFKWRKESISIDDPFNKRQIQVGAQRQRLLINLRASTNKDSPGCVVEINFIEIGYGLHTGNPTLRARQHNCEPVRQRFTDRFESFSSHHHYLSRSHLLKPVKILGKMPRDLQTVSNHPILRHGCNGFEAAHTSSELDGDGRLYWGMRIITNQFNILELEFMDILDCRIQF